MNAVIKDCRGALAVISKELVYFFYEIFGINSSLDKTAVQRKKAYDDFFKVFDMHIANYILL